MKLYIAIAALSVLAAGAVHAADAKVEAAVKTFEGVAASPDKLKAYCAMSKKMEEIGEDEKKAEASSDEMNGYFEALGAEFEEAWSAGDELPENSPDIETLNQALEKLDGACT